MRCCDKLKDTRLISSDCGSKQTNCAADLKHRVLIPKRQFKLENIKVFSKNYTKKVRQSLLPLRRKITLICVGVDHNCIDSCNWQDVFAMTIEFITGKRKVIKTVS